MKTIGSSVGADPTRAASGWQLLALPSGVEALVVPWDAVLPCAPVAQPPPPEQAWSDVQQALGAQQARRPAPDPAADGPKTEGIGTYTVKRSPTRHQRIAA